MPYANYNNAILIDNCNILQNVKVTLKVTEDLATVDGGGFSSSNPFGGARSKKASKRRAKPSGLGLRRHRRRKNKNPALAGLGRWGDRDLLWRGFRGHWETLQRGLVTGEAG